MSCQQFLGIAWMGDKHYMHGSNAKTAVKFCDKMLGTCADTQCRGSLFAGLPIFAQRSYYKNTAYPKTDEYYKNYAWQNNYNNKQSKTPQIKFQGKNQGHLSWACLVITREKYVSGVFRRREANRQV